MGDTAIMKTELFENGALTKHISVDPTLGIWADALYRDDGHDLRFPVEIVKVN